MDNRPFRERYEDFVFGRLPRTLPVLLVGFLVGWCVGVLVRLVWGLVNPLTLGSFSRGMEVWLDGWEHTDDVMRHPVKYRYYEWEQDVDDAPPPVRSDVAPPPAVMPWAREE